MTLNGMDNVPCRKRNLKAKRPELLNARGVYPYEATLYLEMRSYNKKLLFYNKGKNHHNNSKQSQ